MTLAAIIGFLSAILPFIEKLWPQSKSQGQQERGTIDAIDDANKKFDQTGDTSDLGRLPK